MAKDGGSFMSFVSESEIDEKRKKRQEEWEKVRTEDQPQGKLVGNSSVIRVIPTSGGFVECFFGFFFV